MWGFNGKESIKWKGKNICEVYGAFWGSFGTGIYVSGTVNYLS